MGSVLCSGGGYVNCIIIRFLLIFLALDKCTEIPGVGFSAGITISKQRNRLKSDIVEALQFLKCAIRTDLLFQEPDPSSRTEDVGEGEGEEGPKPWLSGQARPCTSLVQTLWSCDELCH
jgi:hypothetical protein